MRSNTTAVWPPGFVVVPPAPFAGADPAKASADEVICVVIEPSCATSPPGEPPHAAARSTGPAATTVAAAVREVGDHGFTLPMIARAR